MTPQEPTHAVVSNHRRIWPDVLAILAAVTLVLAPTVVLAARIGWFWFFSMLPFVALVHIAVLVVLLVLILRAVRNRSAIGKLALALPGPFVAMCVQSLVIWYWYFLNNHGDDRPGLGFLAATAAGILAEIPISLLALLIAAMLNAESEPSSMRPDTPASPP